MTVLKALVIGMGVLIVAGLVFVIVLIGQRISSTASFSTLNLSIPADKSVESVFGGDETACFTLRGKKKDIEIWCYQKKTGKLLQKIKVKTEE